MKYRFENVFLFIVILSSLIAGSIFIIFLRNGPTALSIGGLIFLLAGSFIPEKSKWKRDLLTGIFIILFLGIVTVLLVSLKINHSIDWYYIKRNLSFFKFIPIAWSSGLIVGMVIRLLINNGHVIKTIQVSLVAMVLTILSASVSWAFQFSAVGLVYLISGYICTQSGSFRKNLVSYFILLVPLLLIFSISILAGTIKFLFPNPIMGILAVLIGAWIKSLHRKKKKKGVVSVVSVYVIFLFMGYVGSLNWVVYLADKNTTYDLSSIGNISFISRDNLKITEQDFQNKNVVLYFWSTTCSVCYKKFPQLEKIHKEFKNRDDFMLYAVCCINPKIDEEKEKAKAMKVKYDFPIVFAESSIYRDLLNIHSFPQVILIDKSGKIIHHGDLIYDPLVYVKNIRRILKPL